MGNTAPDPVDADIEPVVPTVTGTDEGSRRFAAGTVEALGGEPREASGGESRRRRRAAGGDRSRE